MAMSLLSIRLKQALARFRDDARGSLSVEAIIILPVLMWAYVVSIVWFDAFRTQNTNTKAAYAISDVLSRETGVVTPEYLDGMHELYTFLSNARGTTNLRVTSVGRDPVSGVFISHWSYATGTLPALTTPLLQLRLDSIPTFPSGETIVFVETIMNYTPAINVGINPRTFVTEISTRPRFAPQLLFSEDFDDDASGSAPPNVELFN